MISDEQNERFDQDIMKIKERYKGRWNTAKMRITTNFYYKKSQDFHHVTAATAVS